VKRPPWSWPGVVAVVLAIGVASTLVIAVIAAEITRHGLTDTESNLIATLGGATIGALATYLGMRNGKE